MKLSEAIKIVKETPIQVLVGNDLRYGEARELLIEAGKREQWNRLKTAKQYTVLLPGETEE